MSKHLDDQFEQLLDQIKDKSELDSIHSKLFKRGVEKLLQAELSVHLADKDSDEVSRPNKRNGYWSKTLKTAEGDVPIDVPRDRNGEFDPMTVPKHKTMSAELEEVMISPYMPKG